MLIATTAVAVVPIAVAWWLQSADVISSSWVCAAAALGLSLGASLGGSFYWKRRRGPSDLLFSELLLWGWLRRWRVERRLGKTVQSLELGIASEHQLNQLAVAIEAQDPYTDGHSRRVAGHSVMVAKRMGLSSQDVAKVGAAAAVHDVGKLRVPPQILNKPGRLSTAEFELVKMHADAGAEIVSSVGDPELSAIVRHHHERFDGAGYPAGLHGEQIPIAARIIAVADTFDAVTSVRPYRSAASHKRALDILTEASGTQLDPAAVRAFQRCYSGSRAVVLWALLAVSPARAVAFLRASLPSSGSISFGALGATVAGIAAVGAATIGAPAGAKPSSFELRPGVQPAPQVLAAVVVRRKHGPSRGPHTQTRPARHHATVVHPTHHVIGTGSAVTSSAAAPHNPSPPIRSGGKPTPSGGQPSAVGTPAGPPAGTPVRLPPAPVTSPPLTKQECKRGGYAGDGFRNQGQCVAGVEGTLH